MDSRITNNQPLLQNRDKKLTFKFKGLTPFANQIFNGIQTSEVAAPAGVDVVSMIVPRTAVDYTRGKDAGIETFRRETSSAANIFLLSGIWAFATAWIFSKVSGVKTTLNIEDNTIDIFKNAWEKSYEKNIEKYNVKKYTDNILEKTKYFDGKEWQPFSNKVPKNKIKDLSKRMTELIENKNYSKKELKKLTEDAVKIFGVEQDIKISDKVHSPTKKFIQNAIEMPREILLKIKPGESLGNVIDKVKLSGKMKALISLGLAGATGFSLQFANRYLTKRKTDSDAFVGLPDYENIKNQKSEQPEEKSKLMALKIASAATIAYLIGAVLAGSRKPADIGKMFLNSKEFMHKLEFKGFLPSKNQLKIIFGATVTGRIFAAADKHELRETTIKDFTAFFNWLVLGDVVTNLAGHKLSGKKLFNDSKPLDKKKTGLYEKTVHLIKNMVLKTDLEIDAMEEISKPAKKILKANRNKAVLTGLLYSTAALGLSIPLLNKNITNKQASKKSVKTKDLSELIEKKSLMLLKYNNSSNFYTLPFDKFLNAKQKYLNA